MRVFRLDPKQTLATRRRKMQRHIAARDYACDLCNVAFGEQSSLDVHLKTKKHLDNVQGVVPSKSMTQSTNMRAANIATRRHYCSVCKYAAGKLQHLNSHNKTPKHIRAVAAAAAAAAPSPSFS
jgi:hypothetical protein